MVELLDAAQDFIGEDKFKGIRISTRPDYINYEVLELLKSHHVTAIELGVQSMSDEVLSANDRGHTSADVRHSAKLIKDFGFELGLQMMVGLYKSAVKLDTFTANELIKLQPKAVRIYPVAILEGTKLAELYKTGEYVPMELDSAVHLCADLLKLFQDNGIDVIRLGLHASDLVESQLVGGLYHPAFRGSPGLAVPPKGVVHTTAGYLVYAAMTHQYVFDYHDGDIYWCTADVGWVTGHSYIVYGPLANGATTLMFEGIPTYPSASRFWEIIDKHEVNIFYTAPTAIRALMRAGDAPVKATSRASLRLLGSVGEPINPEAWEWYYHVVGDGRCPIVDTWWQTETGGILITPLPGATELKPGSATRPFFGIKPEVVDAEGNVLEGPCSGNLVIADSWPGQMRTVYGDHERFVRTYFSAYPGKYFTGDGCRRDEDGDYWITGRVDDVINVSGHRLGTAEVESSLVAHEMVAEAAVVGYPHDIKGQGIYAYVTLMIGVEQSEELRADLVAWVRKDIGPIASPDVVHFAPGLPKTRSGKIMRRILRKIAEKEFHALGDISTLADPAVVEELIRNRID